MIDKERVLKFVQRLTAEDWFLAKAILILLGIPVLILGGALVNLNESVALGIGVGGFILFMAGVGIGCVQYLIGKKPPTTPCILC